LAQGQTLALMSTLQDVDELDVSDDALEHVTRRPNLQGVSPCGLESFLHMLPRDLHLDKVREKTRLLETRTLVTSTREEEEQQRQGGGGGGAEAVSTTTTTDMATTTVSGNTSSRLDFGTIQEEEEEEEDDDNFDKEEEATGIIKDDKVSNVDADEGLVNAWQYKVSVQRERMGDVMAFSKNSSSSSSSSGGEKVYCHSYDLGGKMMDQHDEHWSNPKDNPHMHIIHCSCSKCPPLCCEESKDCAVALFQSCLVQIQEKMAQHPKTVIRLLILNAPMKKIAMALPLLLSYIRHHSLPVVMFVTVRPWQQSCPASTMSSSDTQKALVSLRRVCDAVFACEGFSSMITHPPLEFSDLAGILSIRKIALQALSHFSDTTTSRRPPANRYGMKRDRRKMTIRMLHLPPEDFSAGGSSVGSGARSGGGKVQTDHDSKGGIRGGGGSSSSTDNGTSSTSRATALVPGMSCASHMRQPNNSSQSLDF
jgi:PAXNEB protein.